MRQIGLVVVSILLTTAAGAQDVGGGMSSGFSASGSSGSFSGGTSATGSDWGGADSTSLSIYSMDLDGPTDSSTANFPSSSNEGPVSRIGNVDLVNLPSDAPGYNLDLDYFLGAPVAIGGEGTNWPEIAIGGEPNLPRLDPLDFLKQIVGPEGAEGAIRGLFDSVNYTAGTMPPAIRFLQSDTTQDAFAHSCQAAVDALLPFRGQYYEPCQSLTSASYGQCRAALQRYVQSCLAFAATPPVDVRPPDAPPELAPAVLSRITAVTGILFHEAANPADSRIYCTAVRVSKAWLLTARHCGFQQKQGGWVSLNTAEIRFVPFDNPTQLIKVSRPVDPSQVPGPLIYDENDTSSDYMFFHIDGEEADDALPVAAPNKGDKLVLFSFAVTALIDADPDQASTDDQLVRQGTWTRYMAYDASRTCLVGAMPPPNCLAYACQAEFVSSGGPLFRISGDDVALVGVHVGHIDPASGDNCANPQLLGLVNRGVAPRSTDLDRVARLD